jgi:hypothetical protein
VSERRILEPHDGLQRILYALMVLFLPFAVYHASKTGNETLGFICALWTVIALFYTIEWTVKRIRAWTWKI